MRLTANMRMYGATAEVAALWAALAEWVSRASGVPLELIAHPPPAPIDTLWTRPDMGLVLMCGWPFQRAVPSPQIVAAAVPASPIAEGRAVYWTDMIVAAERPARTLADSFGGRIGYTVDGSHSGTNAPRHLLAAHGSTDAQPLYRESVGPLITPAGAIEAVVRGRCDVAPLDGFFHLLIQKHDLERAATIRTVARTPVAPMPPFVAAPGVPPETVAALAEALCAAHLESEPAALLAALAIARFTVPDPADYALTERWAADAAARGLTRVQ